MISFTEAMGNELKREFDKMMINTGKDHWIFKEGVRSITLACAVEAFRTVIAVRWTFSIRVQGDAVTVQPEWDWKCDWNDAALSLEGRNISLDFSAGATKPNIFLFVSVPRKLKHNCY